TATRPIATGARQADRSLTRGNSPTPCAVTIRSRLSSSNGCGRLTRYDPSQGLGAAMRRREFITLVGGASVWPLTALAQQHDRKRRIGVLMALAADDPAGQARFIAFVQALQDLGWTDGRNVQIDTRWAAGDAEHFRCYAAELVALAPDVILASGGTGVGALLQVSRTVPIVFTQTQDPVGAGYVDSLAQP